MLHTIENEKLICTIESIGAEIRSLKNKASGKEYIWQIDKSIWGSSSPVLFPAIGKITVSSIPHTRNATACYNESAIPNEDRFCVRGRGLQKWTR